MPELAGTDADFLLRRTPAGRVLAASRTVWDVLGWSPAACAAEGLWGIITDEAQRAVVRQLHFQVLATCGGRLMMQLPGLAGPLRVDVASKQLLDEPDRPIHVSARDVSHDVLGATQLAASERQWRVAFEQSPIGGALLDADAGTLVVNRALCRMLGYRSTSSPAWTSPQSWSPRAA